MEEILASIRRIIADDDPVKAAAPKPAAPPPAPPPQSAEEETAGMGQDDIDALLSSFDDKPEPEPEPEPAPADVLDLTESVSLSASPVNGFTRIEPGADVVFRDPVEPPPPPQPASVRAAAPFQAQPEPAPAQAILSDETSTAVSTAFNSLAHTILSNNARTLEDLVQDMLRPMLKQWLDENLPSIVERLVRAEIERVSRGRS